MGVQERTGWRKLQLCLPVAGADVGSGVGSRQLHPTKSRLRRPACPEARPTCMTQTISDTSVGKQVLPDVTSRVPVHMTTDMEAEHNAESFTFAVRETFSQACVRKRTECICKSASDQGFPLRKIREFSETGHALIMSSQLYLLYHHALAQCRCMQRKEDLGEKGEIHQGCLIAVGIVIKYSRPNNGRALSSKHGFIIKLTI